MSDTKENGRESVIGISIPKNINITLVLALIVQLAVYVWNASQFYSQINKAESDMKMLMAEVSKVKEEMYSRRESTLQMSTIKAQLDALDKENQRQDREIASIRSGR